MRDNIVRAVVAVRYYISARRRATKKECTGGKTTGVTLVAEEGTGALVGRRTHCRIGFGRPGYSLQGPRTRFTCPRGHRRRSGTRIICSVVFVVRRGETVTTDRGANTTNRLLRPNFGFSPVNRTESIKRRKNRSYRLTGFSADL